ncbi:MULTISPECIES: hypothetical protein [unclassified Brachybacterium]|uniref:DUF6973 domain-containing protein n=1 Tax=unclassified Brachybacterium TaxID=2623841 RepID=UPI0011AF95DE|nr:MULTISPECIES: hypothetical protein [unclassified Brachybacterium]
MMMTFYGMDVRQGEQYALSLRDRGAELGQLLASLAPLVMDENSWRGPDADGFRNGFDTNVARPGMELSGRIRSFGDELDHHIQEQDEASAAQDDGSGSGAPSTGKDGGGHSPGTDGPTDPAPVPATDGVSPHSDGDDGVGNGNNSGTSSRTGAAPGDPLTQEDADRILEEYQVEDDDMIDWELTGWQRKLAELAGMDIPDPRRITATEGELLDKLGPLGKKDFADNTDRAFVETEQRYGDSQGNDPHVPEGGAPFNDDHADAFRHAYVNALSARDHGQAWATDYWTAHERIPGNDAAREAMDLYNNEVGRRIAAENPGASDAELADLVEQAVANGEMVVIDSQGNLVPSNAVTAEQTGAPAPGAPEAPGHPQERQTS